VSAVWNISIFSACRSYFIFETGSGCARHASDRHEKRTTNERPLECIPARGWEGGHLLESEVFGFVGGVFGRSDSAADILNVGEDSAAACRAILARMRGSTSS